MDLSQRSALLLSNQDFLQSLSKVSLKILQHGDSAQYLTTLSELALDPKYTSAIFVTHESIFVELCSRWQIWLQSSSISDPIAIIATLARILPLAPHLCVFVEELVCCQKPGVLQVLASRNATALTTLPHESLHCLLLALCRLLTFDNQRFARLVSPAQLQALLNHSQQSVRYLAIKIICLYLHASESAMAKILDRHCSKSEIAGEWEGKTIDYLFFTLWEQQRIKQLAQELEIVRNMCQIGNGGITFKRSIEPEDLSNTTASIGDVLVPRLEAKPIKVSSLVKTQTFRQNMRRLAVALNGTQSILVTGFSGAGKSSLIRHVATELGKSDSMITLHLNEQTDAKLLVGIYTSDNPPGSFTWRAGVLTKAILEGRWVIIEDIDRAPIEILTTILPLLERRELFVSHWGESIKAAPGFRMIATMRSYVNVRGEEIVTGSTSFGFRHWLRVPLLFPTNEEFAEIIRSRFPILDAYVPDISRVYVSLANRNRNSNVNSKIIFDLGRPLGPQDLFRWCKRLEDLLITAGVRFSNEPISEALHDMIFVEAVDCFAAIFPDGSTKSTIMEIIAQGLQISPERAHYCVEARKPDYAVNDMKIQIGRTAISKKPSTLSSRPPNQLARTAPFARTASVLRVLESVAIAVKMAEPCLLVGETGTGKTTMIQQLADSLGYKLTVVNLSQQSEAGDLLGGYKPLNARSLAVPMKEEFDDLFEKTFSTKRNQQFIEIIGKAVSKGRWPRAIALWQEALRMFDDLSGPATLDTDRAVVQPHPKRRRLDSPKYQDLKIRWDKFATKVHNFQKKIVNAPKGFVFSFVEGNIVKAARNGDWVLLDEINLASSDTLESLADLLHNGLDDTPSLLLSETGNTERIQVHKDFRIFGAMNPATDVGKRDLPTSLRSRFSEIYIDPPDRDFDNLLSVVRAYLESHINLDVRVAADVSSLYLEIKRLTERNQLIDGADQKPHFSLRTLTRTLVYVTDIAPIYGLRRALFEGFSMSFLTLLKKESTRLLLPIIHKYLLGNQKSGPAFLRQIPRAPGDNRQYVQFKHYWVARGDALIEAQPHYIITPFIEQNLLNLVRATSTRRFPVLLQGPTSSGKTSMIEYLAFISGNKFVRINNHEHTDLQEYLGSYVSGPDGQFEYQEGILVNALREGYWIILDELNLAPTDVLEALNRLLDDNKELFIPETQQLIRPHENFMLFATQNPPGMYGGRKALSRAFRNRFLELHFDDIPEDELEVILRERSQIAPSFCSKIVAVYKKLSMLRQRDRLFEQKNSFATLRDLFRWALRDADDREQLALNGFLLLAERVRNADERLAVKEVIEDVMKIKIDEAKVYSPSSPLLPSSLAQLSSTREVVWTNSMRRLCILVTQALKRNEPVLLVGETGSGKTTICQVIAQIMNTQLHIVNAHQNLETGDLIGSHRPVRNRAMIEGQLTQDITTLLRAHGLYERKFDNNLSILLETYDALLQRDIHSVSKEMRTSIAQNRTRSRALFEWSDGSLVHAMRNGQHFLLDEISLADDSVLERLNSVLESGRNILLAEKGATDNLITASNGFQFLATMNPGGDYGKRELSPALRNRFTEIWVPHATDHNELLEIVQAKLLTPWVSHSSSVVAFAAWYSATFNLGAPAISIRELLAWIEFVNKYRGPDPYSALLHGAAMVYIDGLGANPAAKVSIPEAEIFTRRRACLIKLEELFRHNMVSIYDENIEFSLSGRDLSLGPFRLEIVGVRVESTTYSLQAPTTKTNALKIVRALQLPKPILIEGSPGVGKTTLIVALAELVGIPLTRINLSEQTDLMDLFGSDVPVDGADAGQFCWRDAPFLRAMHKGEWVLLDEMNLASQAVLEGLNSCFDHRGQVYISELDQTFTRHPKFTIFAAQNPHHQGGGRKGLPASFVNRFTVVYADSFISKDLLTICSQNYPGYSLELIKHLTHCVTDIGRLSLADRKFGTRGAPWEINLRDLLRWLHLVTSGDPLMLAGGPADYQSLLFLQRFRSSEDKVAVAKILEKCLPQVGQAHPIFHNASPSYVQVGLGFLTRDPLIQCIPIQCLESSRPNMPLMESVMLCVQNNWPCLLVGSSGCGKTSLIFRLANHTGADVVSLPLSTDMETTDLVGGYEQVDTQREILGLVRKVRQIANRKLIDELTSTFETDAEVAILEERLQSKNPNLSEILHLIRKLANKHPLLEFSVLAEECENAIRRSAEHNRARFEWIDGILVKTLTQGKWLVLDNANLCSPSVLDRLNSLMEPNGFLSVNEHRSLDGSAHIVRPHPNFRLFLTMDPRYGELSRAMRNRCVELYLPAISTSSSNLEIYPACEASLSRFQVFGRIGWNTLSDAHFSELSLIYLDHLAITDYELTRRWQLEIAKGLIHLSSLQQNLLERNLSIQQQITTSNRGVMLKVRRTYEHLGQSLGLNHDFSDMQTINPLNNPALLGMTARRNFSSNLKVLGTFFELLVKIGTLEAMFDSVHQNMLSKPMSQLSRLERSLVSNESRHFRHDSTQPLGKFLEEVGRFLRSFIDSTGFEPEEAQSIALYVENVLSYLRDLLDLAMSSEFDEGAFQVYLIIGRSIVVHGGTTKELEPINEQFDSMLNIFNPSWKLSTGLSMEKLWRMFRPSTAKSNTELSNRLQAEELATRFDNLKWSAGASVRDLDLICRSIVRLYGTINSLDIIAVDHFEDIREALDKLESQSSSSQDANMPHFVTEFEGLCQYKAFMASNGISDSLSVIDLLAGRPTNSLIEVDPVPESWSILSQIENRTGLRNKTASLMVLRNTLPCSLIAAMEDMSEVPLRNLALLRSEVDFMRETVVRLSETISCNHLQNLNATLARLHIKIYEALEDDLEYSSLARCRAYLDQYSRRSTKKSLLVSVPRITTKPETSNSQLIDRMIKEYINPSLQNLCSALKQDSQGLARTASAWIIFFTGFLYAYVPDRPFDPALKPLIERNRYNKRKSEVQSKLSALQEFEMLFSGQKSSTRSQILEKKLQSLGNEPPIPSIVRPQASELTKLQGEFNNILVSIIQRSPDESTLRSLFQGDKSKAPEMELLRLNITQAISRLSTSYRAYDDVTKPLIAMLKGLDVGLAVALLTTDSAISRSALIRLICESTPFLGMRVGYLSRVVLVEAQLQQIGPPDPRLSFLNVLALSQTIDQDMARGVRQTMHEAFLSLYKEWKEKLGRDQRQEAAKSSMYRYRGAEENDDETNEKEFLDLFPNFNEETREYKGADNSQYNPKTQAQHIARCQQEIFRPTKSTAAQILSMLAKAATDISAVWERGSNTAISETPAEMMLCAVIMGLDTQNSRLNSSSGLGKTYSFYADANVPEVQKLVLLVQSIQSRFSELAELWPDHATIKDVLQVSSELMELRHIEPLAKVITKAEQVHSYVHEWQIVASKEYSAIQLYEQLTSILINWRRLELSTWARLLDMEDRKCIDDAESWWFLAYEVIVAIPLSAIHSGEDLQIHSEQLFATLADFLRMTSIGQYSQRLRLIDCFKSYLGLLIEEEPTLVVVQNTLVNFLSFYVRFEKTIQEFLHNGRLELEKDMKEILLLASWKDTNITALRESAKRSHHKLFKVVRKYRALLAQSADKLITHGVPDQLKILELTSHTSSYFRVSVESPQALQIIRQHVPDWNLKRERFTNPALTAKNILRMTQLPPSALDNALYLECFANNLVENIKMLQKETASKATKDNKEKVKHLKSQKRKLFADTLKSFRHMGLRSNISVDALAQQTSTAVILAKSLTFQLSSWESNFSTAEYHFHKLLHVMSQVREKYGNHSEDLSHGDISRSIGFLEGILTVILKQRAVIARSRQNLDHLEKGLGLMQNLCVDQTYTIHRDQGTILDIKETKDLIKWLPGVIEAGCFIIKKHTELGGDDSMAVIEALTCWKNRIANLVERYRSLPDLPIHLFSSLHEEMRRDTEASVTELKANLHDLSEKNRHVGFVLRQIGLWIDSERKMSKNQISEASLISLAEFDYTISKVSDSILVAIQRVKDIISCLPESDEDRGWLTTSDMTLSSCLRALHPGEVNILLRDALSKACLLETPDGGSFEVMGALCAMAMPIVQQYCDSLRTLLDYHIKFHRSLCNLASTSAQSFCQVAAQGFCTPSEDSAQEAGESEKLEGGTGLGEGEGVNDISKDVEEDEDLSELAQEPNKDKNEGSFEDQKDALSMDKENLEGDIGEASGKEDDDDESGSEEGDIEIDDEIGDVDDLDPSAVDEKLWDGLEEETEKEKEGSQATGKKKKEQVAGDSDQKVGPENSDAEDGDNSSIDGAEESEQVGQEDTEKLDPHLQEGKNLDLPEDMDLGDGEQSSISSGSDENDDIISSDNELKDTQEQHAGDFDDDTEDGEAAEEVLDKEEKIQNPEESKETEDNLEEAEQAGSPVDTEPDNDEDDTDTGLLRDHTDDAKINMKDDPNTSAQGSGQDNVQEMDALQNQENSAQGKEGAKGKSATFDDPQAASDEGTLGQTAERSENVHRENLQPQENSGSQAFKKLGDALEKWHRQQRQIQDAQESRDEVEKQKADTEMADQDFEHLGDEAAKADTQALGAATQDQADALNEQAFESQMQEQLSDTLPEDEEIRSAEDEDTPMENLEDHMPSYENHQNQTRPGAIIVENLAGTHEGRNSKLASVENQENDMEQLDNELSITHLQPNPTCQPRSLADALSLWTHYSTLTHTLSLTLTEQLRLILAPTLATKMRGDFRTGKRLNMKRIIPYIASSYKRDKIWMRRSMPQKRAYQILLAVDDSKSMGESSAGHLAFETLALVAKSLSMLEVGEICVVGFGAEVTVAHEFDKPFAVDAGVEVFRQFTFRQERTDVRKLIERSISLFHDARKKSTRTGAADLWQLQLIISDGVCEEHEAIRRLVRRAQEERIIIVFVIVDDGKGESILDMSQAIFEPDGDAVGPGGEKSGAGTDGAGGAGTKLRIKRYLDDFPFAYYLVVREVRELPGVLAKALRQWFAEVVESG